MANTSAIWQQAAHPTDQLSSPSCPTRAIQKSLTRNEIYLRVFWGKKSGEWTISRKNDKTERARGLGRKKNKRGDRKGESNDSPEIPDPLMEHPYHRILLMEHPCHRFFRWQNTHIIAYSVDGTPISLLIPLVEYPYHRWFCWCNTHIIGDSVDGTHARIMKPSCIIWVAWPSG